MLSSTSSGVRTRSSYKNLIANKAFVILQEPKSIKDALLDPDCVDADSSESDEASPSLNPQAEPFVPQAQDDHASEDNDTLSEHSPLTSTPLGLIDPSTPSASTLQVEPMSPPRIHSMIKAHPPYQMLSSTSSGVRTRSSYENLIANQAFVSL